VWTNILPYLSTLDNPQDICSNILTLYDVINYGLITNITSLESFSHPLANPFDMPTEFVSTRRCHLCIILYNHYWSIALHILQDHLRHACLSTLSRSHFLSDFDETVHTDTVGFPTTNLGFFTAPSSIRVSPTELRHQRNGNRKLQE